MPVHGFKKDDIYTQITYMLLMLLEIHDAPSYLHSLRVSSLSEKIATELDLDKDKIEAARVGGLLHDIGKIALNEHTIEPHHSLLNDSLEVFQRHTVLGYEALSKIDFPWPVADIARHHHERINGSGYPDKLAGTKIPLLVQIVGVADTLDSILYGRSNEAKKGLFGLKHAFTEIEKADKYNQTIARACIDVVSQHFDEELNKIVF